MFFLMLATFVGIFATTESNRAKARYYFTQGSIEAANDNAASAYEYFKKAYETDPSYSDAAFTYGSQRLFVRNDTLQSPEELVRSLDMMRGYVDANPADLYATQMYGYVTSRLDTVSEAIRVYERVYELMPRQTQILMTLSDAYMIQEDFDSAIGAIERYEKIEGKSSGITLKKVTLLLAKGDTIAAVAEVDKLIEEKPRDSFSRILKGNLYEVIGQPDSVLAAYKEAGELAPENGAVKMAMANYYRERGDSVMLDNMIYEALISEDFDFEDKISILGDYLQKLIDTQGDKSRGDNLFAVLKKQYPLDPDLIEMSARYNAAKGNFKEAAEEMTYAIDLDGTNDRFWLMKISYLLADSNYDEIIETYGSSKEYIEPTPVMKNLYAASATQIEDNVKARNIIYELLAEINPILKEGSNEELDSLKNKMDFQTLQTVSNLFCNLGDIDYKAGKPDSGFDAFEKALLFNPENALALNNFAYFLAEEDKDLEKAKEMSFKSLELSGNNPTYLDTYAWILYKLGKYEDALEYITLAIDMAKEEGEENEEYEIHIKEIRKALGQ